MSGCASSRQASSSKIQVSSFRSQESRDTVREQVVVAVHDTIIETKTITITKNEAGDTTFTSIVTERDRLRDRLAVKDKEEKLIVRVDTVYMERRDSVQVSSFKIQDPSSLNPQPSPLNYMKWIFWILCAIIVLIIVIRLGLRNVF